MLKLYCGQGVCELGLLRVELGGHGIPREGILWSYVTFLIVDHFSDCISFPGSYLKDL